MSTLSSSEAMTVASLSTAVSLATTLVFYTGHVVDTIKRPSQPVVWADLNVTSLVNLYIYINIYSIHLNINKYIYSKMVSKLSR